MYGIEEALRHGLEGVLVAESELSDIDRSEGRLVYRGSPIEQLAAEATFEETLYLLWYGHLPDRSEYEEFVRNLVPMAER